jgi:ribosomal protein S8
MITKSINFILFSILNNSLLYNKKNYQLKFKNKYLNLLIFLKKNNFIFYFKKIKNKLNIYFKFLENISVVKNIKIYNHLKKKKVLNLNQILKLKIKNKFLFFIFYNRLGFLTIEEVLKLRMGAFLIAKLF